MYTHTPSILYLSGRALCDCSEHWYQEVEQITREEPQLLTKTRKELEPASQQGHVLIAVDKETSNRVVGGIVLWDLDVDDQGQMWYELGTFFVHPSYRFHHTQIPIGDTLYARLLKENEGKNILGTTANIHAIHTGARHGMQMIRFGDLPERIRYATCICPSSKTGVVNNTHCLLRNETCRVRVSHDTWIRLGSPLLESHNNLVSAHFSHI